MFGREIAVNLIFLSYFQNLLLYFQAATEDEKADDQPEKQRKFQLSSLNPQERFDYCHLIEELGNRYL